MKEFKGTKGEWTYLQQLGEVVSKPSGLIADLVVNGEEDHNGRLIAAAPGLLEALQKLRAYVTDVCGVDDEDCHAEHPLMSSKAAISKALGEE